MSALQNGETLNRICRKVRGERLTYRHRYLNYCAAHPEYARVANELLARNTELLRPKVAGCAGART